MSGTFHDETRDSAMLTCVTSRSGAVRSQAAAVGEENFPALPCAAGSQRVQPLGARRGDGRKGRVGQEAPARLEDVSWGVGDKWQTPLASLTPTPSHSGWPAEDEHRPPQPQHLYVPGSDVVRVPACPPLGYHPPPHNQRPLPRGPYLQRDSSPGSKRI